MSKAISRVLRFHLSNNTDSHKLAAHNPEGPWKHLALRLLHKKVAFIALLIIGVIYIVGLLAPLTAPHSYRDTPSTDLQEMLGFPNLLISEQWSSDNTLYNNTSLGIFRSKDGGKGWVPSNKGIGPVNVAVMIMAPITGAETVLYAGTNKGIFVSRDSSDSWESASQGLPDGLNVNQMAISPNYANDNVLFVALSNGIYRTLDGGLNWTLVNTGFQNKTPYVSYIAISPNFGSDSTVFSTVMERKVGTFQNVETIYRSSNGGTSWEPIFDAPSGNSRNMTIAISSSFTDDGIVYVSSSEGLLRSTNYGNQWQLINGDFGSNQVLDLTISPSFKIDGTIYVNTISQGIFRSTDKGLTWSRTTNGLSITKAESLVISPEFQKDATLLAGTVDGALFRSDNGGELWHKIASKDLIKGPSLLQWPPNLDHPLGTDRLGRDLLSRVIYGIRTTVIITLASVLTGSLVLGVFLGAMAGYFGRRVDALIMRTGDIFLAFPGILLVILIAATLKPRAVDWARTFEEFSGIEGIVRSGAIDYFVVFGSLALFSWVGMARLVRGQFLQLKQSQYVEAARAMGASNFRIIFRHILPNAISPIIVSVSMGMGTIAGTEVILSWFGIGIQPPNPSLGRMILENFGVSNLGILREDPHLLLVPAVTIAIIIYSWNLLGDGLNDILNPQTE